MVACRYMRLHVFCNIWFSRNVTGGRNAAALYLTKHNLENLKSLLVIIFIDSILRRGVSRRGSASL
jgi:hypothetical protein